MVGCEDLEKENSEGRINVAREGSRVENGPRWTERWMTGVQAGRQRKNPSKKAHTLQTDRKGVV